MGLARRMTGWHAPFRHLYVILIILVSWVLFRAASLPQAWSFLAAMAGLSKASGLEQPIALYADTQTLLALAIGLVGSTPVVPATKRWLEGISARGGAVGASVTELALQASILMASVLLLAAGTYNPFIYF